MPRISPILAVMAAGALLLTGCPDGQSLTSSLVPPGTGASPANGESPTPAQNDTPPREETPATSELMLQLAQMPTNSWLMAAPMAHARGGVSAGTVNGKLFALGGDAEATVELYDPARDAWTLSYLPPNDRSAPWTRARSFGAAVASHGRIFYVGGSHNWVDDHLDVYNPETHMWLDAQDRTLTSSWFQRTGLAAVVTDGLITLIGGSSVVNSASQATAPTAAVVAFYPDVTTGWSETYAQAPLPAPRSGLGAAVLEGRVHVVGGFSEAALTGSPAATSSMLAYRLDDWSAQTPDGTPLAPLNTPRHSFGSAVLDGKWIVAGGMDSQGKILDSVEAYDPATNTWTTLTPMPKARVHLALASLNGRLFAIGGFDAQGKALRSVDVYRP